MTVTKLAIWLVDGILTTTDWLCLLWMKIMELEKTKKKKI